MAVKPSIKVKVGLADAAVALVLGSPTIGISTYTKRNLTISFVGIVVESKYGVRVGEVEGATVFRVVPDFRALSSDSACKRGDGKSSSRYWSSMKEHLEMAAKAVTTLKMYARRYACPSALL